MRKWNLAHHTRAGAGNAALAAMIGQVGRPRFEDALLEHLDPLVPAASCSIYRIGRNCVPRLYMSASRGVPDTTRQCWQAYLSGPYLLDRTLLPEAQAGNTMLCHITAQEVAPEHRARVYEAHGVAERVSVVRQQSGGDLFAVNFYRHGHQRAFSDGQLSDFEDMAPALLALTQRHVELAEPVCAAPAGSRAQLAAINPALTPRELDVCECLLQGMTQEGIARALEVTVPTVKTYRNRAFDRLGIHFRNELFALVLRRQQQ